MQKPPLDPDVADYGPGAPTGYDEEHLITYLRLLDAERDGADWKRLPKSYCTSTPRENRIGRDAPGKLIWPARDG
jgi:hypothetical protein